MFLDVPEVKVDEITLDVEELRARVSLQAEVLDLLRLNVGADVSLGAVHLEIKGVAAQALLKVRLDNVADVISRVLTTIDRNPQILEQITSGLGSATQDLGGAGRGRPSASWARPLGPRWARSARARAARWRTWGAGRERPSGTSGGVPDRRPGRWARAPAGPPRRSARARGARPKASVVLPGKPSARWARPRGARVTGPPRWRRMPVNGPARRCRRRPAAPAGNRHACRRGGRPGRRRGTRTAAPPATVRSRRAGWRAGGGARTA